MTSNPFETPAADAFSEARQPFADTDSDSDPIYFSVSPIKLVVMSVATFGFYDLYWLYKQFSAVKARTNDNSIPIGRTIFAIFFIHGLFKTVLIEALGADVKPRFAAGAMTAVYILTSLTWRLPSPLDWLSMFSVLALIPVQGTINDIHGRIAPTADKNDTFSVVNWLVIVPGALLFVFTVVVSIFPELLADL